MTLQINYQNGYVDTNEGEYFATIEEAMEAAEFNYTQNSIYIEDAEDGEPVALSAWYGYHRNEDETTDEDVIADFGRYGFFLNWYVM